MKSFILKNKKHRKSKSPCGNMSKLEIFFNAKVKSLSFSLLSKDKYHNDLLDWTEYYWLWLFIHVSVIILYLNVKLKYLYKNIYLVYTWICFSSICFIDITLYLIIILIIMIVWNHRVTINYPIYLKLSKYYLAPP